MSQEDELWRQNLEQWIFDDGKIVTYRNVAISLKVHFNVAKKMLSTFKKDSKRPLKAVYLVAGTAAGSGPGGLGSGLRVKLIEENRMEQEESNFDKLTTKHLFALGKMDSKFDINDILNTDHKLKKDGTWPMSC